jgi:hypothetical protein
MRMRAFPTLRTSRRARRPACPDDFGRAKGHLDNLEAELDETARQAVVEALMRQTGLTTGKHDIGTLSATLAALVPSLISVVLNPEGSDNELAATVRDIHDKQRVLAEKIAQQQHLLNPGSYATFGDSWGSRLRQHATGVFSSRTDSCDSSSCRAADTSCGPSEAPDALWEPPDVGRQASDASQSMPTVRESASEQRMSGAVWEEGADSAAPAVGGAPEETMSSTARASPGRVRVRPAEGGLPDADAASADAAEVDEQSDVDIDALKRACSKQQLSTMSVQQGAVQASQATVDAAAAPSARFGIGRAFSDAWL